MAFVEVNGAQLYYETFGEERPDRAPAALIHGATSTGRSNWSTVAALLSREYLVIVPDCRGHGQSSNPGRSYSFREMAADTAGLVKALGYERAHIIGHSNGGNVALITLLEYPEVVQSAVIQAANAWVSPDLVEKEPAFLDPERVRREASGWMKAMIALHGEMHGADYWRELLQMTAREIISEPNYTPSDLQAVRRPALIIQGEQDRVNALYEHAQFIARYIPQAELWIPAGVGHTVHNERLGEWIEKVLDFLARRGDDDQDALYRLGRQRFGDRRDWVYAIQAQPAASDQSGGLALSGRVMRDEQRQAVLDLFAGRAIKDEIQVLLREETPWALVNQAVSDLRQGPDRQTERLSQALLGEAVRILEVKGDWAFIRLEDDGYLGWMQTGSLYPCTAAEVRNYQAACSHLVMAEVAPAFSGGRPGGEPEKGLGREKLPFGVAVPVGERQAGLAALRLPDGTSWWTPENALLPISERPQPNPEGIRWTLELVGGFGGTPYLWGGRTPFGFDCSGLAQAFWKFMGVQLRRDASQQFQGGTPVAAPSAALYEPGDLLFFGQAAAQFHPAETGEPIWKITHVAISLGGPDLIHASGSPDRVIVNSLDPASRRYSAWLSAHLAGARRYR